MEHLACSLPPNDLAAQASGLYGKIRPEVPTGAKGWGATRAFDLAQLKALAR